MPIYKQITEITNIDDLLSSVERDIEEVYFGDKKVFTVWGTYDGTLPTQYSANGSMLADYRIYGAAGGVGDRTVNVLSTSWTGGFLLGTDGALVPNASYQVSDFIDIAPETYVLSINITSSYNTVVRIWEYEANDTPKRALYSASSQPGKHSFTFTSSTGRIRISTIKDVIEQMLTEGSTAPASYVSYGYEVDMSVRSANIFNGEITHGAYSTADGSAVPSNRYIKSSKTHLDASGYITLSFNCPKEGTGGTAVDGFVYFWNGGSYIGYYQATTKEMQTAQIPDGATDFAFAVGAGYGNVIEASDISKIMLNYGSTPLPYQPYSNTTTPIYIGDTPLGEDEYVSFKEQKVYRMVNGVLTPQDPPVPLPALPTVDGVNIVNYAGQSAAMPSRFYAKFRKEGFN